MADPSVVISPPEPPPLPARTKALRRTVLSLGLLNGVVSLLWLFFMLFVVPVAGAILADSSTVPPGLTVFVIDTAHFLKGWWWLAGGSAFAVVAVGLVWINDRRGPEPAVRALRYLLALQLLWLVFCAIAVLLPVFDLGSPHR